MKNRRIDDPAMVWIEILSKRLPLSRRLRGGRQIGSLFEGAVPVRTLGLREIMRPWNSQRGRSAHTPREIGY